MRQRVAVLLGIVILIGVFSAGAYAAAPVRVMLNGQEIQSEVPLQVVNERIMVPLRWFAEALGATVQWSPDTVSITTPCPGAPISKQQVEALIISQGTNERELYYMEGLSFELANIDSDPELEIVAKIDGAVHLGELFIFDQQSDGEYRLIAERGWKTEEWDLDHPIEVGGKKVFRLVTRDGGTGIDVHTAHLWYIEQGEFVQAWEGVLLERVMGPSSNDHYVTVGSYQLDGNRLYTWETTHQLAEDGITPIGELKTTARTYLFDGTSFRMPME